MKQPRWFKELFRKRVQIIFFILLQIIFLLYGVILSVEYFRILNSIFLAIGIAVALNVISKRIKPAYKLLWVIILLAFPFGGTVMYLLIKVQRPSKKTIRSYEDNKSNTNKSLENSEASELKINDDFTGISTYLQDYLNYNVYSHTQAKYFALGDYSLKHILTEIKKAEKCIYLEYFIIEQGKMWDSILGLLKEKVKDGVDVRVMYDDIGCFFTLPTHYQQILESMGIKCKVFNKFSPILSAFQNNRDHRKMLVIDGKVVFTGGINLADEYINAYEKYGHWKDNVIMLKGEIAWSFAVMFNEMWNLDRAVTEDFLPEKPVFDINNTRDLAQPYFDGPIDGENVGEHIYSQIISNAKEYLYVITPYLVVDDSMLSSLILAAKRGVDVRIITPFKYDKLLVHITTRSYYYDLIEAGVKVYEYSKGFAHSKLVVADDKIGVVGTTNMDFRSFYLHFECGVCVYDDGIIADTKKDFLTTQHQCKQIEKKELKVGYIKRLAQQILRIFAPLM